MSNQYTPRPRKSDAATVKLLKDVARLMANHMWHLQPDTEGGKLYQRVEEEIARLEQPSAGSAANAQDVMASALRRIKQDTMHARRFGAETLQNYRGACVAAEGFAEDALNEVAALSKATGES